MLLRFTQWIYYIFVDQYFPALLLLWNCAFAANNTVSQLPLPVEYDASVIVRSTDATLYAYAARAV
jgi:hypothetical protein